MIRLNSNLDVELDLKQLQISELSELYNGTIDKLRVCASVVPGEEIQDKELEVRQEALLDLEATVLNQAAYAQLSSEDDVLALMDMWAKVVDVSSRSPSDRIAMNIFRHMNDVKFSKE